jgi:hypothetical protein
VTKHDLGLDEEDEDIVWVIRRELLRRQLTVSVASAASAACALDAFAVSVAGVAAPVAVFSLEQPSALSAAVSADVRLINREHDPLAWKHTFTL